MSNQWVVERVEDMIRIGDKRIGESKSVFVIADIGSNHNGNLKLAEQLIDEAKKAGADCVKFQLFKAEELISPGHPAFKTLKRLELPEEWHYILAAYAKKKDILFTSTPFYLEAVDILEKINVPFYKISSGDLTYRFLLEKVARTKKPIFLSTGASYLDEVERAVKFIKKYHNHKLVLMHCVSLYPPDTKEINLNCLKTIKEKLKTLIGISDHTRSLVVVLGAVAIGACVVERHLTLSRRLKGPDHPYAMQPDEFREMVANIRELEVAKGSYVKRPCPKESPSRQFGRRKKVRVEGKVKYLRTYEKQAQKG